jgi:hypothetical protein
MTAVDPRIHSRTSGEARDRDAEIQQRKLVSLSPGGFEDILRSGTKKALVMISLGKRADPECVALA